MKDKNLLEIKTFKDEVILEGYTYYDSHSRAFNIIRLPAAFKVLYPEFRKHKVKFEIRCFPSKKSLLEYLENNQDIPLIVNLLSREERKPLS